MVGGKLGSKDGSMVGSIVGCLDGLIVGFLLDGLPDGSPDGGWDTISDDAKTDVYCRNRLIHSGDDRVFADPRTYSTTALFQQS